MIISYLYCFDDNYNNQAFSSMASLLDQSSKKIEIFIIHKSESCKNFMPEYITNHPNLINIELRKFKTTNIDFPNVNGAHISEATYYRIYFDEYIVNKKFIVYIDSDFICNSDPYFLIEESIRNIEKNNTTLGAVTQYKKNSTTFKKFDDIKMKSNLYFNAGLLIVNVDNWKSNGIKDKLLSKLNNLDINLEMWDQDLLNNIIDGNYYELQKELNWQIKLGFNLSDSIKNNQTTPVFFHFLGKHKPWVGKGLFTKDSEIYQSEFRKHSNLKYHIEHRWILNSLKQLLISFFNLEFSRIKFKFTFLYIFFFSYIKKKFFDS